MIAVHADLQLVKVYFLSLNAMVNAPVPTFITHTSPPQAFKYPALSLFKK